MSAAILRRIDSAEEFEAPARRFLPRLVFGYVHHGVEDQIGCAANRAAFGDWALRPTVLGEGGAPDLATELLGQRYSVPFGVAPMGGLALGRFRGDLEAARGATAEEMLFVLSGASAGVRLEQVAEVSGARWFQAYLPTDRAAALALAGRVEQAGYRVLVVTVDVPVASNRSHYQKLGYSIPFRLSPRVIADVISHPRWLLRTHAQTWMRDGIPYLENFSADRGGAIWGGVPAPRATSRLGWGDIAVLRSRWRGPLVLKGILSADDALRARQEGVDGVILSNHGGRQLDRAVAPLRVLPQIAAALPDYPVMIDGGFRRGSEILIALALGARHVFIGRPFYYAIALAGAAGVRHLAGLLRDEMTRDMIMLGVRDLAGLNRDALVATGR